MKKDSSSSNSSQEPEKSELEKIGQNLKAFRETLTGKGPGALSQEEFAEILKVTQSKIGRYELGQTKPDYSFLIKLAREYGLKKALEIFDAADLLIGATGETSVELSKPILFKAIPLADSVEGNRLLKPHEKAELVFFIARRLVRGKAEDDVLASSKDFLESRQ